MYRALIFLARPNHLYARQKRSAHFRIATVYVMVRGRSAVAVQPAQ